MIYLAFFTVLSDAASKRPSITTSTDMMKSEERLNDRYHPAPLRDLSFFGESSARAWSQAFGLGIGGSPPDHAKTGPDGADRRLPQDARVADRCRHLLRYPVDHARTRAPASHPQLLSRRPWHGRCAFLVGREDDVQPGCEHQVRKEL